MAKYHRSSAVCPNCGNDLWEIVSDQAECGNCSYRRPYHRRSHNGEITPTQKRAIAKIRRFFDWGGKRKLHRFETTFQKQTGFAYVVVYTDANVYLNSGGHFCIGRRGGIKVLSANDLNADKDGMAEFYAQCLGGKVGWGK